MSVIQFAEEFTRLILRHTKTNELSSDDIMPLNNEEIVFTIHHVLDALNIKNFNDKNNNSNLIETSNGNAEINPETSTIKIKCELDMEDASSCPEDVQSVFTNDSSVSEVSLPVLKKEREGSFDVLQNEKKFISRSNPMICVNNISRSDTFIREGNQKKIEEEVFESNLSGYLLVTLTEIRKFLMNITVKLNDLEQLLPNKITVKKQKSSLTNSYSSPRRTSTINKTRVSTNACKSSSNLSGTPTSSKMLATENKNIFERRKSTGGIGANAVAPEKSGTSTPKMDTSNRSHNQSVSIMNLSTSSKISPSVANRPHKFTKNPKYAHVRSTIPKAISQKKKIQES
ncbi:uncharacterized protein LOC105200364 [Solenopsis invicta]|uniref:uncharacterized protein LOC105200364 n=1 Tax=Solenopsis invicta TaxID=13686 RepID=UPI00193DE83E|nr:uncharacterized protein LOC105200364 [Solenopsis invicta]